MTSEYELASLERFASAGNPVCEHRGDSYVAGSLATGFELFKNKELQGRFKNIREAMLHLDIIADVAGTLPIGRG